MRSASAINWLISRSSVLLRFGSIAVFSSEAVAQPSERTVPRVIPFISRFRFADR